MPYTLGIDFGTNTARALVVDTRNGEELGAAVAAYPSGEEGVLLDPRDPHLARQHPGDYVVALRDCVRAALERASAHAHFSTDQVLGIGVDGTGSSPIPVDARNRPLALDPAFASHPAAQCWLWKDHTSIPEAAEITRRARETRPLYLAKIGGVYSSEWFWAKILRCLRVAPGVFAAAHSWVELSDWIPALLAGVDNPTQIRRGVCMAGHKAMWSAEWGGLPDEEFLGSLDPALPALRHRLFDKAYDASSPAGSLCPAWAETLGLPAGIAIAVGAMDVHYGAIGCGIDEGTLVKVIGTSTCDCAVVHASHPVADIPGICGIVPGAILPGYVGIEAGQSAVGDIFKWWVERVCLGESALHAELSAEAASMPPGSSGLLALDWNNGNRTILVDQELTGLLVGQTLYTRRAEIYRALLEATAFGARAIIDRLTSFGVPIHRIICSGGIAEKNALLMQIYADVTGCEMRLARSNQACALGAAVSAAVAAGVYDGFAPAQAAMTAQQALSYQPNPDAKAVYDTLYNLYLDLHDAFGGVRNDAPMGRIMKDLLALKRATSR